MHACSRPRARTHTHTHGCHRSCVGQSTVVGALSLRRLEGQSTSGTADKSRTRTDKSSAEECLRKELESVLPAALRRERTKAGRKAGEREG